MHTLKLETYPDMHPAAGLALGSLKFGRGNLNRLLSDLTPEQLTAKPENFKNDLATLANHIAATEISISHLLQDKPLPDDLAARFLLDQPPSPLPRPAGATVQELQEKLAFSMEHVEAALARVTAEDLPRIVPFGPNLKCSVDWLVALLPTHQFHHYGQMQMLLRQL